MGCPQCQSDEISPSGVCLICGFRAVEDSEAPAAAPETGEEDVPGYSGMIEMDCPEGHPEDADKVEIPQWRQELSQRLHDIKQKKEVHPATQQESRPPAPPLQAHAAESVGALQAKLLESMPVRRPQPQLVPPPRQITLQPVAHEPAGRAAGQSPEIRNLIDNAVSRQITGRGAPAGAEVIPRREPDPAVDEEGKLILLSRTLSGLIDLIVIMLCTGCLIIAADLFSGIIVLDTISLVDYSVLFLLNYFLYSLFFLAASNQTIGMMITDLRVVGAGERRPSMSQLLRRCCGYLASVICLGAGLLSGLFDRESLCFHDRHSGTRVVRL